MKKFKLDYELVEKITLESLKDQRKMLKKMNKDHLQNGTWLHPDDLVQNAKLIDAMTEIIDYYGG
jgi:GTPase Era involved in 16S rRNA processing